MRPRHDRFAKQLQIVKQTTESQTTDTHAIAHDARHLPGQKGALIHGAERAVKLNRKGNQTER